MARKLIIGIAGYTGEMGGRHLRAIRTCLDRLDCTADFYLYVRHPKPVDFPATICASEEEFYTRNYDLLVLAMHPHHRRTAYLSLASGVTTANLVYLEKPLWTLSAPQQDRRVFTDFKNKYASRTVVNFQENFDPLTQLIITLLQGEKQGVPVLTVKDIFCHRSKDRTNESERLHKDNRHSEPIIIQEAVHDLGFAMHILSSLTRPLPSLQILSAHAYDLKHTTGDTIPLAGSSYAMLTTQQHDTHIMLINSFIDPLRRKYKYFVCTDERDHTYNIYANYIYRDTGPENLFTEKSTFSYRSVIVRNARGEAIYDAEHDDTVQSAINIDKYSLDQQRTMRILRMVLSGAVESNFELAYQTERLCAKILKYQEYIASVYSENGVY